jgi:dephospho-CoA kinase
MIVLGLTGGIGMGKSTAAAMLRGLRVPVHDADAAVHRLLARGGAAVGRVAREFPGVLKDGAIDRAALAPIVFADPPGLRRLEALLHPLVRAGERRFLRFARQARAPVVVLDIPLLYEVGAQRRCDAVVVVSAPPFLQRARALKRQHMTPAILAGVLKQQWPDPRRRRAADFVVPSGLGRAAAFRALRRIVREARACGPSRIATDS